MLLFPPVLSVAGPVRVWVQRRGVSPGRGVAGRGWVRRSQGGAEARRSDLVSQPGRRVCGQLSLSRRHHQVCVR